MKIKHQLQCRWVLLLHFYPLQYVWCKFINYCIHILNQVDNFYPLKNAYELFYHTFVALE
jgi:hypothetical protein